MSLYIRTSQQKPKKCSVHNLFTIYIIHSDWLCKRSLFVSVQALTLMKGDKVVEIRKISSYFCLFLFVRGYAVIVRAELNHRFMAYVDVRNWLLECKLRFTGALCRNLIPRGKRLLHDMCQQPLFVRF